MKYKIWEILGILFIAVFALSSVNFASATSTLTPTRTIALTGNLAYDNNTGEIFAQYGDIYGDGFVSVINDTTNKAPANITIGVTNSYNNGLVYDSGKGEIFASSGSASPSEYTNPLITVISDSNNSIVDSITYSSPGDSADLFPSQPGQMAYDSGKGEIFVTDTYGYTSSVYVINDSSNIVFTSIGVGGGLGSLVYDNGTGEIFVAYSGVEGLPGGIAVISDNNDTVVKTINMTAYALAYDPVKNEIFALTYNSGYVVSAIDDSNYNVVANITGVTGGFSNAAYDSGKGWIFIGGQVISDSTYQVIANLPASIYGYQAVYDSGKGETFGSTDSELMVFSDSSIATASGSTTPTPTASPTASSSPSGSNASSSSSFPYWAIAVVVVVVVVVLLALVMLRRKSSSPPAPK